MPRFIIAVLLAILCVDGLADPQPDPQTIVAPIYSIDDPQSDGYYYGHLLRLVLDKTVDSHGAYRLVQPANALVDHRLRASVDQGFVDVAWFNASPELEEQLLAVREPLLGDINRYRLLLIRQGDQARFSAVKSLEDLRAFTGGIGAQWVDAEVMLANNLPYVTTTSYVSLFRMLVAGRFDYFSRGLYQIKRELDRYPELNLAIEENLMLYYPNRSYFFVAKGNTALAERLQLGIDIARRDGSFAALFNSIPHFVWAQELLDNHSRTVLRLDLPAQPGDQ